VNTPDDTLFSRHLRLRVSTDSERKCILDKDCGPPVDRFESLSLMIIFRLETGECEIIADWLPRQISTLSDDFFNVVGSLVDFRERAPTL